MGKDAGSNFCIGETGRKACAGFISVLFLLSDDKRRWRPLAGCSRSSSSSSKDCQWGTNALSV